MSCFCIRSFERQSTVPPSRSALPKSLAQRDLIYIANTMNSAPTSKGKYESTFCLPSYPPATHPPYHLTFNPHPFFSHPFFYKSELVALEKWVWKFEMRHHYVVKNFWFSFKSVFFFYSCSCQWVFYSWSYVHYGASGLLKCGNH